MNFHKKGCVISTIKYLNTLTTSAKNKLNNQILQVNHNFYSHLESLQFKVKKRDCSLNNPF